MNENIINDNNFEQEIAASTVPVLIDFFAPWCGPCKLQGPIIDELQAEMGDKIKVFKMNVDENQQTAQKFDIMSIPTIIIFHQGQEAARFIGLQNTESLLEKIKTLV